MNGDIKRIVNINYKVIGSISLDIIGSLLGIYSTLLIREIIDSIFIEERIIEKFILFFVLVILQYLMLGLTAYLLSNEGDYQIHIIRNNLMQHLVYSPISKIDNKTSGELSSKIINNVNEVRNFLTTSFPLAVKGVLQVIVILGVLFNMDWKLTLIIFTAIPIESFFSYLIGNIIRTISISSQKEIGNLNSMIVETLSNLRSIKLNTAENQILLKFKEINENFFDLSKKNNKIATIFFTLQNLMNYFLVLLVILYGGIRVGQNTLTSGTLVSFIILLFQLIPPFQNISSYYNDLNKANGYARDIILILNENIELNNKSKVNDIGEPSNIKIENLSLKYEEQQVLKDINIDISKGEKIGIVGPTGSGKTSIINALTKLYFNTSGKVTINGVDSDTFPLSQWRSMFAIVSQENAILSGSLLDNMIFGLDKIPTMDEINKAVEISCLQKDIKDFPEGILTEVGESGVKLSSGQKQRLQIARAYLKNTSIIILDEATSNLDVDTEKKVLENLTKAREDIMLIVIAHRLNTILDSDRIYFVSNQQIEGYGSHSVLYKKHLPYKKFIDTQFIEN